MLNRVDGVQVGGVLGYRLGINREYLMSLKTENLLLPFYMEAGLRRITYLPKDIHDGWDSPLSDIRGCVTGCWLSAAAMTVVQTGDAELKGRADHIVSEIERCQLSNDNNWCFPIPEKYLHWLKRGKSTWAPHYVLHKVMMGLFDMYRYTGNQKALSIIQRVIPWFVTYTEDITDEQMERMMHEETGGIMELFADLYGATGDENCLTLMRRYERKELYRALLEGKNAVSNQHANVTIPEIHGAARAYEVTGEERYRRIVETYWQQTVRDCVPFVTGGQTNGESWTPPGMHSARLGETNQEHCVVYHMMRLADYLFRWTGNREYADYWERNLLNGVLAQTYYRDFRGDMIGGSSTDPKKGHIAYFLPLHAGAKKIWGKETGDFWCCHSTLMLANAFSYRHIYFTDDDCLVISQYQDSSLTLDVSGTKVSIWQYAVTDAGNIISLDDCNREVLSRPMTVKRGFHIQTEAPTTFTVRLRIPGWASGKAVITLNGAEMDYHIDGNGFAEIRRSWSDDYLLITIPKAITVWSLPDRPDAVAFLDGPVALAGLCDSERTLTYETKPEDILIPNDERRWNSWLNGWQTVGQYENIRFIPLNEIGFETYTVYFPTQKKSAAGEVLK